MSPSTPLLDSRRRPLRDLRISVTDRCNFRCIYCMPKTVFGRDYPFLPRNEILNFEEIARLSRIFANLGVKKLRLTGGEPLLRHNLEELIAQLASIPGLELTLTTNAALLGKQAGTLKQAGLHRITVSLDALDDAVFRQMTDSDFPVSQVLAGIEAAAAFDLPVKVNMVVKRGINDSEILPMVRYFRNSGHTLRFIEFMDAGNNNQWQLEHVLPSNEIATLIGQEFPIKPLEAAYTGEVAERWRYTDGAGEIGFISSVSKAFCNDCTRLRMSTDGKLYTCLFADTGFDLRALLRQGANDNEITAALDKLWSARTDRYSELRNADSTKTHKIEMSYIGG